MKRYRNWRILLNIFDAAGRFPVHNGLALLRVHPDTLCGSNEAEVRDFPNMKLAFRDIGLETCIPQELKDLTNLLGMIFLGAAIGQDIVNTRSTEDVEVIAEGVIDIMLERGLG